MKVYRLAASNMFNGNL